MAKGASQTDLEQRIVGSEAAADRVGDVMRLLPLVLLRDVTRVQRAYDDWLARAARYEDAGDFTDDAVWRCLFEDSVQLNALVRDLNLQRYRWLPKMLRWEFQRALEQAPRVDVRVPRGLDWATRGKRPKEKPGAMGGFRLENLERTITLFVRCEVNGDQKTRIATAFDVTLRDLRYHVRRARTLLDCVSPPQT